MADSFCPKQADGIPHALRPGAFARMNGHVPTRVARATEMLDEESGRKVLFVACEVERHNIGAPAQ